MKGPLTAYLLAFISGGSVIYIELATKYRTTQRFALHNRIASCYFILHAFLSLILFHIINSIPTLDLVGKFLV